MLRNNHEISLQTRQHVSGRTDTYNNRSLRGKVKPDERQGRRNRGKSPQSMKNKDHIEALGTEVKSLKMELESMRSCRLDARSSEQDS